MITIGMFKPEHGREQKVQLNAAQLIKSRMLVTANSGGGKSYLLRVILEQLGQTTPIIVLDREGDYVTLGERLDVVQVGPNGEIPADVRSAGMLCRRLMEKRLSAVIDLSELPFDRKRKETLIGQQRVYVREFLDELGALPRKLWRPTIIVLDEVHLFAPEKGHGEAESTAAVVNAATLGRKRAYCTLMATQRIGKLIKDAAAEQGNRFFGGTTLDIDVERSAKDLGMTAKEARPLLRDLEPGEFFGFGRALYVNGKQFKGIVRFRAAKAHTTHPEPGQGRTLRPPKPSKAIAAVLSEFTDLPKEAEQEIKDLATAKAKITELDRELRRRPKERVTSTQTVEVSSKRDQQIIARLRAGLENAMKVIAQINAQGFEKTTIDHKQIKAALEAAGDRIMKLVEEQMSQRNTKFDTLKKEANKILAQLQKLLQQDVNVSLDVKHNEPFTMRPRATSRPILPDADDDEDLDEDDEDVAPAEGLTKTQQRAVNALAWWESVGVSGVSRNQLGAVAGISPQGGYLDRVLAVPSSLGLITRTNGMNALTAAGRKVAAAPDEAPDLASYHKKLRGVVKDGASRKVFNALVAGGLRDWTREEIGEATGIKHQGGYLDRVLAPLTTLGVITRAKGIVTTTKLLFPDELM